MKIAFYVYPTAFQSPGGGEVLLLKTKEYLEKEGVSVKLFDTWNDKLTDFDILHVFGSVKDAFPMMELAHRVGVKTVLSTVCWYSWQSAWGTYGTLAARATSILRHAAKVLFPFVPSQRKKMMETADVLIPNSTSEAKQLARFFCVPTSKIVVIPNGVDPVFAEAKPDLFLSKYPWGKFVLCVGRIEPRKNQLTMIRAMNGTDIPFVILGDHVKQYPEYYQLCRKQAGPNIHFLGALPHDSALLRSAYAACDTFLLATWLETPGLAALEAALAGAKVVITQEGATKEYFREFAAYVNPANPSDIREKTLSAVKRSKDTLLQDYIRRNFLWKHTAKKNLETYHKLLHNNVL